MNRFKPWWDENTFHRETIRVILQGPLKLAWRFIQKSWNYGWCFLSTWLHRKAYPSLSQKWIHLRHDGLPIFHSLKLWCESMRTYFLGFRYKLPHKSSTKALPLWTSDDGWWESILVFIVLGVCWLQPNAIFVTKEIMLCVMWWLFLILRYSHIHKMRWPVINYSRGICLGQAYQIDKRWWQRIDLSSEVAFDVVRYQHSWHYQEDLVL